MICIDGGTNLPPVDKIGNSGILGVGPGRVVLPVMPMFPLVCCLILATSSGMLPVMIFELFHSAPSSVDETTNLGILFNLSAIPNSLWGWES